MRRIKLISLTIYLMATFSSSVFAMKNRDNKKDMVKEYHAVFTNYQKNPNVYSLNSFVDKNNKGDVKIKK